MKIPDKVIRKSIAKHFQLRGRDCVCLTKREYQTKIDAILFDISSCGYTRELLDSYNDWIMSKIAWIPEDDIRPRRESTIQLKPTKPREKTGDSLDLLIAKAMDKAKSLKLEEKRTEEKWRPRLRRLDEALARIEAKELKV